MLVNVVSRNGTLLLNFPLKSDGTLDAREMSILSERAPGRFAAKAPAWREP